MSGQHESTKISTGRQSQKNRTRMALVEAADQLMRAGRSPTVSEAGEAAGISRATAYRYFPTQELLLAEVALFSAGGPLFPVAAENGSVPEAVSNLVGRVGQWTLAHEQPLRTLLRLSLDPSTEVRRPGHRVQWIASALEPVRGKLKPATFKKLSQSLTLLMGIDPIVVMKDVAGASREEALDALKWTAAVLVEAALREQSPKSRQRRGS